MSEKPNRFPTLSVEGFGPIESTCPIPIKPITVFVGPSNTGKSYLALLLHAMSTSIHSALSGKITGHSIQHIDHFETYKPQYISLFENISYIYDKANDSLDFVEVHSRQLSPNSIKLIRIIEDELHADISQTLNDSIANYFQSSDLEELADEINLDGYYNHEYAKNDRDSDPLEPIHKLFEPFDSWSDVWSIALLGERLGIFSYSDISPYEPLRIPIGSWLRIMRNYNLDGDTLSTSQMVQLRYQVEEALLNILRELPRTIYFPASRSGIIASHQLMISAITSDDYLRNAGHRERISRDIIPREFLRHLLSFNSTDDSSDESAKAVADIIEAAIMNGEIQIRSAQYGAPEFIYSSSGFEIPLTRSSSMVTELGPIILFMRYIVRAGDLLIIEEPEAHLHPAAQQKFAAALALLVRNGFRVLITTHSHYMVEQISDFVAASNLSPEKRRELLRLGPVLEDQDIYLNEDEVGVYGFDNSSGSTFVKNIPFDENFAYAPADHIQALTEQFNRNVGIMRAQRNGHSVNGHDAE